MPSVTVHPPGYDPAATAQASQVPAAPAPVPAPRGESPSQRIVSAANALQYVTDADGRTLGWRKLDALEEFDLSEIAGSANVTNAKWMLFATLAFCCREIDGQPVSRPSTKDQMRARVKLLGGPGLDALYAALVPQDPTVEDGTAEAVSEPNERDRAKN